MICSTHEDELNEEYLASLKALRSLLCLDNRIIFLRNISNAERTLLLERSTAVLYTPVNEIGIGLVPIEAMALGCLVIACNSGG